MSTSIIAKCQKYAPFLVPVMVGITYFFSSEIKGTIAAIMNFFVSRVVSCIFIKRDQFKSMFAIKQELKNILTNNSAQYVSDGYDYPHYEPHVGHKYTCQTYKNDKGELKSIRLLFKIEDEEITIYTNGSMCNLQAYFSYVYSKYNCSDAALLFYMAKQGEWDHPMYRRPKTIPTSRITSDMQAVITNVDTFMEHKSEMEYKEFGRPYRKGYMLLGTAGTGKSSLPEIIAQKYHMKTYVVQLNNGNMTDESLIRLCLSVDTKSIIIFDELDKQYGSVIDNDRIQFSNAGLLGAIDGIPKLPHGTLIFMTANSLNVFNDTFKSQLMRPGRIDELFHLNSLFNQ